MKAYRTRYLNIKSSEGEGHRMSFYCIHRVLESIYTHTEALSIPDIPDILRFLASTNKIVLFTS